MPVEQLTHKGQTEINSALFFHYSRPNRTSIKLPAPGAFAVPVIVCVLPDPVFPYANTVAL